MLSLEDIYKDYDQAPLLKGVSLEVHPGEIVCLLGTSGSGKSTLLRIIAGLEAQDRGCVLWSGEDFSTRPCQERGFGLMFQDYALFPHKSVAENIAFGLKMQKRPPKENQQKVQEALIGMHLEGMGARAVTTLSGGEQQRVALARALAPDPKLLMLDEPMGALDHSLRLELMQELRTLLRQSQKAVIYVSHDREEAFYMADRLLLLHEGRILQSGSPEDLYAQPQDAQVARFLGLGALIPAHISDAWHAKSPLGRFTLSSKQSEGQKGFLLLRPQDAVIVAEAQENTSEALVEDCVFIGECYRLKLTTGGILLDANSPEVIAKKQTILLHWPAKSVQFILSDEEA